MRNSKYLHKCRCSKKKNPYLRSVRKIQNANAYLTSQVVAIYLIVPPPTSKPGTLYQSKNINANSNMKITEYKCYKNGSLDMEFMETIVKRKKYEDDVIAILMGMIMMTDDDDDVSLLSWVISPPLSQRVSRLLFLNLADSTISSNCKLQLLLCHQQFVIKYIHPQNIYIFQLQ